MKILHVSRNLAEGGLERCMRLHCRALAARGHENIILHGRGDSPTCVADAARTFCVDGITHPRCMNVGKKLQQVRDLVRREAPDVVLLQNACHSDLIEYFAKTLPTVCLVHHAGLVCPGDRKTLNRGTLSGYPEPCTYPLGYACQVRAYTRRCMPRDFRKGIPRIRLLQRNLRNLRQHAVMVVPSNYMANLLMQNGFARGRVHVVPHFTPLPKKRPRGPCCPQDDDMIVTFIGRINKGKGVDVLLQAISRMMMHVHVNIVGDGPDLTAMKALAVSLGISGQVRFHGWVSREDMEAVFDKTTVVVTPSLCPEAFCMVGIEAMAHSLPVIGSAVGGIPQWLSHERTGLLFPPGDADALAHALDDLLSDPVRACDMGREGYERVRDEFCESVQMAVLEGILLGAAAGKRHLRQEGTE